MSTNLNNAFNEAKQIDKIKSENSKENLNDKLNAANVMDKEKQTKAAKVANYESLLKSQLEKPTTKLVPYSSLNMIEKEQYLLTLTDKPQNCKVKGVEKKITELTKLELIAALQGNLVKQPNGMYLLGGSIEYDKAGIKARLSAITAKCLKEGILPAETTEVETAAFDFAGYYEYIRSLSAEAWSELTK